MIGKFSRLLALLSLSAAPTTVLCQDPVAALLKTQHLSTIPGVYQSAVEPGALLILRDHGHTVAYEDASDASEDLKKRSASITLAKTELAKTQTLSLTAKLFGYEPGISFASGTQLSYDAAVLSGIRLTGYQMTKLITTDPETIQNIKYWLFKGYHVYLVEAVLATPKLYVSAANGGGLSLALNKTATACTTTPPTLPAAANPATNSKPTPTGQPASSSVPTDTSTKTKNKTSADSPAKSGDEQKDGTQATKDTAAPVAVEAQICKGVAGHYALESPAPVNIAVKLEEIVWHEDPTDSSKIIYDYVPVEVAF